MGADARAGEIRAESTASATQGPGSDQYLRARTAPVPSSGLSRDHGRASLVLPIPGARAPRHGDTGAQHPCIEPSSIERGVSPSRSARSSQSPSRWWPRAAGNRHDGRDGRPPRIASKPPRYRLSLAGRCWPAIVLIRDPETSLRVSSCSMGDASSGAVGEAEADRDCGCLDASRDPQLGEDVPDVDTDRLLADEQALTDLAVRASPGDLDEHLTLSAT